MNPQTVWRVWRRIMRDPDLQHALFDEPGDSYKLEAFGFSDAELAAAQAYAKEAERAKWFVVNYRYRLINSFLNALETGAPLVLRSLLAKGADLRELGAAFLEMHGWKDYGPFVYTYCVDALRFLEQHPVTEVPTGLRDLIGLEHTLVNMLIQLSTQPPARVDEPLLARTPNAAYFRSSTRLSDWMRQKNQLGKADLGGAMEHYLMYLTNLDSAPKFVMLPPRAAEIYRALERPCARHQLADALEVLGFAAHDVNDDTYLTVLAGYRAINHDGRTC